MREAEPETGSVMTTIESREGHWLGRHLAARCSICSRRAWLDAVRVLEPEDVPEPRHTWILCKSCHQALLVEMDRSPILSPLRLRIAVGIVASERWSQAHPTLSRSYLNDRKWFAWMAILFFFTMIFHLALIVMLVLVHTN